MSQKKEGVCFTCTAEQEADLKRVISELKDTAGALMPILQHAQEIFGYLPIEVQTMISGVFCYILCLNHIIDILLLLKKSMESPHSIHSFPCSRKASTGFLSVSAPPAM